MKWRQVMCVAVVSGVVGCMGSGGGGGAGEVLVVRPGVGGWERYSEGGEAVYRRPDAIREARGARVGEVPVAPRRTVEGREVGLGNVTAIRREAAAVAAERGLEPVTPSAADLKAGWTEVFAGKAGEMKLREEPFARYVEVWVRGGELRRELEQRLGVKGATTRAGGR